MSNFLYFIPNESPAIDQKKLVEFGLSHAFEAPPIKAGVTSGPDGNPGILLSASPERIGFYPDKQTWKRFPRGVAWVGFYHDSPPTPAELQRQTALQGHDVELLDGNKWLVPLARQFRDEGETWRFVTALPQSIDLNDSDEWVSGEILPKYQKLWDLACEWWDNKISAKIEVGDEKTVLKFDSIIDVVDAAVAVLSVNYRLGRNEIAALGLLSVDHAHLLLDYLIDFHTLLEWSKKNPAPPDSSSIAAG